MRSPTSTRRSLARHLLLSTAMAMAAGFLPSVAQAGKEQLLHSFSPEPDGYVPVSGVIRGPDGTLYGLTEGGGDTGCNFGYGCGALYKITPDGKEVILHSFHFTGGQYPFDEPALDDQGNLYGTTSQSFDGKTFSDGQVFKFSSGGTYSVLHTFNGPDGAGPGGLIVDNKHNIFGVAPGGGPNNYGVLYKINSKGAFTILHAFTGADGSSPSAAPLLDDKGNIFGTTLYGGAHNAGTVYKVAPNGRETVLHSFNPPTDGYAPRAGVVRDDKGNLYGTGQQGGVNNYGTLFKLTPSGHFTVLHAFGADTDGRAVYTAPTLVKNDAGKLEIYGLTAHGGINNEGTFYKYSGKGHYKILHNFTGSYGLNGPLDGGGCQGLLTTDLAGNFYGACNHGGAADIGTVFKIHTR